MMFNYRETDLVKPRAAQERGTERKGTRRNNYLRIGEYKIARGTVNSQLVLFGTICWVTVRRIGVLPARPVAELLGPVHGAVRGDGDPNTDLGVVG